MAARSASLAWGAASSVAGSPVNRIRTKIVTLRMNSDASAYTHRLRMKRVIAGLHPPYRSSISSKGPV
jgi:hypothetical protein